jgi:MFS transporter, MHS family, proline/betaine transporter
MVTGSIDTGEHATSAASRRALLAACVGNVVEWYDFAIFGALGVVLVPVFFPSEEGADLLLAAFAVYATAFLARPLGAVLAGRRGDVHGRQRALASVVLVMSVATAAIGLLPGHARIGVLAGVLLVVLRATQGLAAGGELGLAAVFMAEHAPRRRRGVIASWHTATLALGVGLGFGVGGLILWTTSGDDRGGWWRIAFLAALPLGLVGVYVRRRVTDTPLFVHADAERPAKPVREVWLQCRPELRAGFALAATGSLAFNTWFVFLPNHLVATTDRTLAAALLTSLAGLLVAAGAAVGFGRWSDLRGRRPIVLGCVAAVTLSAVPMWLLAGSGSLVALAAAQSLVGAALGGVLSVAMLAELFPTRLRATGLALTAGLGTAVLGGTAPLVEQILVTVTGFDLIPAVYVTVVAAVALFALAGRPETAASELA